MTVSRVDAQKIGVCVDQGLHAVVVVDADGGADAEAASLIPGGSRVLHNAVDIPHRDQAGQLAVIVDQQQLLDLVFLKDVFGLFQAGARRTGHEVRPGHDRADLHIVIFKELQIAPGQDADQLLALDDRNPGNVLFLHQLLGPADRLAGREGHRIENDAMLRPLDLGNLPPLGLDGEVLVDDADAAFLGQRNRQSGLGDRIHGGRDDRDIDRHVFRELRARIRLARHEITFPRDQQDIVKCDAFDSDLSVLHRRLQQPFRSTHRP